MLQRQLMQATISLSGLQGAPLHLRHSLPIGFKLAVQLKCGRCDILLEFFPADDLNAVRQINWLRLRWFFGLLEVSGCLPLQCGELLLRVASHLRLYIVRLALFAVFKQLKRQCLGFLGL